MTPSERRVLMSHAVADATETALKQDDSRVPCFACAGCLLEFTKSDNDDKTKPQGVVSKNVVPSTNTHAEAMDEIANPLPNAQENLVSDDVREAPEDILPSGAVVEEDNDVVLATNEALEDAGLIDSNDESHLEG